VKPIIPRANPELTIYQFTGGFRCIGGQQDEPVIEKKHVNKYVFASFWIHKREEDLDVPEDKFTFKGLNARFVGALNNIFSPGVGDELTADLKGKPKDVRAEAEKARHDARWQNTLSVLQAAGEMEGLTPDTATDSDGNYDFPLHIATCAAAALNEEERVLLVRTGESKRKDRDGNETTETIAVGFRDLLPAICEKAKIVSVVDEVPLPFSTESAAF
jgi:hypothetical protein